LVVKALNQMLRNWFCIFIAGAATAALFPLTVLSMVTSLLFRFRRTGAMWVVRRLWSPTLLWAGGAKLVITGLEHIDASQPMIYASNHQSTIDIPVLFRALPVDVRFAAKKSLSYVPFLGWYMWLANFIFIDRQNRHTAVKSLREAGERIRSGVSIIMFPEGTRSETNHVLPFKKGPFALAVEANVPIVPIAIEGSGKLMPKNSWNITPGPIYVSIGKPISVSQFAGDREALMQAVEGAVVAQNIALGGLGATQAKSRGQSHS
jgi:1-acyl-sn-glycerol-3-phosphate acyltransferase